MDISLYTKADLPRPLLINLIATLLAKACLLPTSF